MGLSYSSAQDEIDSINRIMSAITLVLAFFSSISFIVGGLMIINTMIVPVYYERTREIGIAKAIGASHFETYRNELEQIGFILSGSITKRFMRCGTVGCRCQTDPKAIHGPYYEWTRKVRGKMVYVRLKKKEAEQLMEWIENK